MKEAEIKKTDVVDFPLGACPKPVRDAAEVLHRHYGLPLGTGAIMALTAALAAAGNRGTLTTDGETFRSASPFTVLEAPDDSRISAALSWLTMPIWGKRGCLTADGIVSGHNQLARTSRRVTPDFTKALDENLLQDAVPLLDARMIGCNASIMIRDLGRLPVWQDAISHSFDHGLLGASDSEALHSLWDMEMMDRQNLFGWMREIWSGEKTEPGSLPGQLVLLWQMVPDQAIEFRHVIFRECSRPLPVFVVPWRETQTGEEFQTDLPTRGPWERWLDSLLEHRLAPHCTVLSYELRAAKVLAEFTSDLGCKEPDDSEMVERTTETARRLAVLFAVAANVNEKRSGVVNSDHVERAFRIADWLFHQHQAWMLAGDPASGEPMENPASEEFIQGLEIWVDPTPERVHRLLTGQERLDASTVRKMLENLAAGAGPDEIYGADSELYR